jgi:hypothetical protein
VAVHVGIIVATGWGAGPGIVRIIRVARTRWTILIRRHAATGRRSSIASFTSVVELAWGRASAVVVPARAVTARRTAAIVVIIVRSGRIAAAAAATAAAHRRAGAVSVTTPVIRAARASVRSPWLEWRRWRRIRDILDACHFLTLELTAIQLLHGGLQVGDGLVLDESGQL